MKGSGERLRNLLDLRRIPRKDFSEAMSISPQQLNNWFGQPATCGLFFVCLKIRATQCARKININKQ
jgi:hypothetical protein